MNDFEEIINEIFDKINLNEEKKVLKVTKKQIVDIYNNDINKKTKKTKKNKKTKKPKTAYNIYYKENYKNVKDNNPEMKIGDISKILAEKWKNISDKERKIFEERSKKEKEEYNLEIKKSDDKK